MYYEIISNLVITKVHSVSTMYTLENARYKKRCRQAWAAVVKYEGKTVYTVDGKDFLSDLNHMVILPKGCVYEWQCTEAGHYSIIEFECDLSYHEPLTFNVKNSEQILKMFKELECKWNFKKAMMDIEIIRDTYSIIIALLQSDNEKYIPSDKYQKLLPAIEYVSQNYNMNITNDTLASLAGVSTVYFRKLFAAVMGVSPIAYAHRLRIEKAKEMLKSDYGTLTDLAQTLGYSSLYDFSRDFKKHTGVPPSKYEPDN